MPKTLSLLALLALGACNDLGPLSAQRLTGRYQLSALEVLDPNTRQRWTLADTLPGSKVTLEFSGLQYTARGTALLKGAGVDLNSTGTYAFETYSTLRFSDLLPEVYWVLTWANGRNVLTATLYDPRAQDWTLWITFRQA